MNAILSIKPIYTNSILSGKKKVEFRKASFKREVRKIYIYSSSPDQRIIGYFLVKEIISDKPKNLWNKYNEVGYFILIDKVFRFKNPINPNTVFDNFTPPQSFCYCEDIES